jgi:hypothetical protein
MNADRLSRRRLLDCSDLVASAATDSAPAGFACSGRHMRTQIVTHGPFLITETGRSCWWAQAGSNHRPPACKALRAYEWMALSWRDGWSGVTAVDRESPPLMAR